MVLDSLIGPSFASKKRAHNDKPKGDSEMEEIDRKRLRILAGNTKSSYPTMEAAIQPHRSQ